MCEKSREQRQTALVYDELHKTQQPHHHDMRISTAKQHQPCMFTRPILTFASTRFLPICRNQIQGLSWTRMSPAFSSNFLLSSSRMIKQALAQYALSRDLRFIALQKNVLEVSLIEQWQTIITHSNNDAHKNVSLSAMPAQLYEKLTCCNVLWLLYNKTFNNHYFHAWTCIYSAVTKWQYNTKFAYETILRSEKKHPLVFFHISVKNVEISTKVSGNV